MKALIVTGGTLDDPKIIEDYYKDVDLVVCADSGANYLNKCGIEPDVLIGDFDSINQEVLSLIKSKGVKIISHLPEKDYTDTQLAVEYALELGAKSIVILGGLGSRIDHSLANIYIMAGLISNNISCILENDFAKVQLSTGYLEVNGRKGDTVSLLPITDTAEGVTIEGFKYPINNGTMIRTIPYGISNILENRVGTVRHNSGILAVIQAKQL